MNFFENSKPFWIRFYTIEFRNSFVFIRWVFIEWEQNYQVSSTFLSNDSSCFIVLIENIWFKTKSTESTKIQETSFPIEIVKNVDLHVNLNVDVNPY